MNKNNGTISAPFQHLVRPSYEFLLHFWGEIFNDNLIEKELGIKGNYLWFDTADKREAMKTKLRELAGRHKVVIAFSEEEGELVRKRTMAKIVFESRGKRYGIDYDFGYGYPADAAEYMFTDGNYGCDCNRSIFIHEKYPEFPETNQCGDDIEMTYFEVVYGV